MKTQAGAGPDSTIGPRHYSRGVAGVEGTVPRRTQAAPGWGGGHKGVSVSPFRSPPAPTLAEGGSYFIYKCT